MNGNKLIVLIFCIHIKYYFWLFYSYDYSASEVSALEMFSDTMRFVDCLFVMEYYIYHIYLENQKHH